MKVDLPEIYTAPTPFSLIPCDLVELCNKAAQRERYRSADIVSLQAGPEHATCAEVPWVTIGHNATLRFRCNGSSPMADAVFAAESTSPG